MANQYTLGAQAAHWRKMAAAFEAQSERRRKRILELEERLAVALGEAGRTVVGHKLYDESDPLGELMSARLLIRNLRQQLRQRPAA